MVQTGKVLMMLRSGIELEVAALSLLVRNQLQTLAGQAIPLPDPTPFEVVVDGITYAGDDKPAAIPAVENEAYRALVLKTRHAQGQWVTERAFNICVICPEKEALLRTYEPNIAELRRVMDDMPADDWTAILKCFLTTQEEYSAIVQAISQALPLTDTEVRDALGYYSFRLQGDELPRTGRK